MNRWFATKRRFEGRIVAGGIVVLAGLAGLGRSLVSGWFLATVLVVVLLATVFVVMHDPLERIEAEIARGSPEFDLENVLLISNRLISMSPSHSARNRRMMGRSREMLAVRHPGSLSDGERKQVLRLAKSLWLPLYYKGEGIACLQQCVRRLAGLNANAEETRLLEKVRSFRGKTPHRAAAREAATSNARP